MRPQTLLNTLPSHVETRGRFQLISAPISIIILRMSNHAPLYVATLICGMISGLWLSDLTNKTQQKPNHRAAARKIIKPQAQVHHDTSELTASAQRAPAALENRSAAELLKQVRFADLTAYYKSVSNAWRDKFIDAHAPYQLFTVTEPGEPSLKVQLQNQMLALRAQSNWWRGEGGFNEGGHQVNYVVFFHFMPPNAVNAESPQDDGVGDLCTAYDRYYIVDDQSTPHVEGGIASCYVHIRESAGHYFFEDSTYYADAAAPMSAVLIPYPTETSANAEYLSMASETWASFANFNWSPSTEEESKVEIDAHRGN